MTYQAIVRKGQLDLSRPIELPEGAEVEVDVRPVAGSQPARGSLAALRALHIEWAGDKAEFDAMLNDLSREKWEDVERTSQRDEDRAL